MLQFRNQTTLESKQSDNKAYDPKNSGSNPHANDLYDTDSSASASSDNEGTAEEKKSKGRKDDEGLLVRSTISRDTTQNTPTVDSIDLSKMAAHTGDLPLNARDPPKPSAPRVVLGGPPPPLPLPAFHQDTRSMPPPPQQSLPQAPLPVFHRMAEGILGQAAPTSILAKIKPGRDLRSLYRDTWSDRPRYAPYNWHDKLRVTSRRKSESNLDIYRKADDNSWISQHLPQNASRRRLVNTWKLAGHKIEQNSGKNLSQRTGDAQPVRDMGANLGRLAERHLGLDLYDDSPQSMFFSHLLNTIEALRAERNFLEDLLTRPQAIQPPLANAPKSNSDLKAVPEFKILHRVFCKSQLHSHDQVVFEDMPVRVFSERSQDLALSAKMMVRNFNHYCSQHPNISFIIFKEYLCVEDTAPRARFSTYQRRNLAGAEISPRAQRMCIVSDILKMALYHVASCSLLQSRISSQGMQEMAAPYLFLYHHREALRQYEKEATGMVRENVSLLLGFLESDYSAEYCEADAEFSKGVLTMKHIEKLYRPNEIVIERSGAHDLAYMVRDWPEIFENEMKVSCWSWQYYGMFLERHDTILKIKLPLPENSTIDKLPFCPISIAVDTVIETLKERGRKFWSMKGQYFSCFSGLDINKIQSHNHIRVVVDMFTYSKMHAAAIPPVSTMEVSRFDPWPNRIPRENDLDDSMILLLPPHVFGFMLQEKQWLKLDINGIHPIEWNKRAFDRLVLDPKTKELITALVEVRISAGRAEDIIGGKGNGLMILLHGGPGTGKTLTAESVAEIAEKPLYRVTCGDIGTKADDVEKYLQTVLYLGKIWNCVLLLDEADIFLEERTIADLERNSLVSVFLRILEYYDGILIMTSNRVGTFDEAFKSRIQVSLHYEDLTKKARRTIWNNFIVMLEEAGEDVNISDLESHLEEIALEEMNGRQIRNAMTTARQLALHRKERLHWEHLDQVLKTAREFNRYLKNVQGHTDKQWAREQRLR